MASFRELPFSKQERRRRYCRGGEASENGAIEIFLQHFSSDAEETKGIGGKLGREKR